MYKVAQQECLWLSEHACRTTSVSRHNEKRKGGYEKKKEKK